MTQPPDTAPAHSDEETETGNPSPVASPLPFLSSSAGVAGRLKVEPEDFEVEEIPAYEPHGTGHHLFLWIEKREVSGEHLMNHLSKRLKIKRADIGMAGLKDRRAVTRQYVSVPDKAEDFLPQVDSDEITIHKVVRHSNKLHTGHLNGNRFKILLRTENSPTSTLDLANADASMMKIAQAGFPNYFGDQRFGRDRDTLTLGYQLMRRERTADHIAAKRRRFVRRLALSSVQSDLFNQVLADRIKEGTAAIVQPGDVLQVTRSGGVFVSEDSAAEQERLDRGEVGITGPIFGPKMRGPALGVARHEQRILKSSGLTMDSFVQFKKLMPGTRRPFLVRPRDASMTAVENGLLFEFTLPKGCYATMLFREITKT